VPALHKFMKHLLSAILVLGPWDFKLGLEIANPDLNLWKNRANIALIGWRMPKLKKNIFSLCYLTSNSECSFFKDSNHDWITYLHILWIRSSSLGWKPVRYTSPQLTGLLLCASGISELCTPISMPFSMSNWSQYTIEPALFGQSAIFSFCSGQKYWFRPNVQPECMQSAKLSSGSTCQWSRLAMVFSMTKKYRKWKEIKEMNKMKKMKRNEKTWKNEQKMKRTEKKWQTSERKKTRFSFSFFISWASRHWDNLHVVFNGEHVSWDHLFFFSSFFCHCLDKML
jgi:hypothetical protein